jgi:hypothetical protein
MAESYGTGLSNNTATTLNANFKELYADRLQKLMPENTRLIKDIKPRKGRLGKQFHMPVALKQEHGFTYALAQAGAFAFNNVVPGIIKDATIDGCQLHGWCAIDYETAAKGANSKTSFVDSVGHIVESLWLSAQRRREIRVWYGQAGLGRLTSNTSGAILIDTAYYAPAIWVGMEGAKVSFTTGNAGGPVISSGMRDLGTPNYTAKITSVANASKTFTIDQFANTTTSDWVVFESELADVSGTSCTWQEGPGIHAMLSRTYVSSGTATDENKIHGIYPYDYSLWQPNTFAVGSTVLSVEAIQDMVAAAVAKGLEGTANLYCNPTTVSKLITDLGGLRRFQKEDGKKYTIGAADIEIECQGILVKIVSCPYIWEGFAYLFNPDIFSFIQAYPLSSKVPGRGDDLFYLEPGFAAYSMQIYSHEGLFCEAPCLATVASGIVNT